MKRFMLYIFALLIALFIGCYGMKKKLGEYKLTDGSIIELVYYNGGATAPMGILVKKKGTDIIIDDLENFDDSYSIKFNQINDSLLKLTFTGTPNFKSTLSDTITQIVHLNKRITLYP